MSPLMQSARGLIAVVALVSAALYNPVLRPSGLVERRVGSDSLATYNRDWIGSYAKWRAIARRR